MKIALISLVFPHPRRGIFPGIERHVYEYSRALRKRGHEVRVITTFWNGGPPRERFEGIEIRRLPDTGSRFGNAGRLFALHVRTFGWNLPAAKDLLDDADVVQAFIALPATEFLNGLRAPVVSTFYHRDEPTRPIERLVLPSLYAMERRFFRDRPLVLTFSESSRDVLVREYGVDRRATDITPLGVDTDRFCPITPPGAPRPEGSAFRMLFVGALIERKGVHHLIEALGLVNSRRTDWTLTLVGDGRERAALEGRAKQLGFAGKVEFRGYVDGWDGRLPEIYRQADLFVFPSLKEGFGMVIAEAMACGTPVITTRVSAIPEVVGDAGMLVDPSNPEGLAAGLLALMEDDMLRARLGREGAKRAMELFSWDRVVDRTLDVFQRLSGSHS